MPKKGNSRRVLWEDEQNVQLVAAPHGLSQGTQGQGPIPSQGGSSGAPSSTLPPGAQVPALEASRPVGGEMTTLLAEEYGLRQNKKKRGLRYKGVQVFGADQFAGKIQLGSRSVYLGMFKTEMAAALAHDAAALFVFGETAMLNFPDRERDLPPVPGPIQERIRDDLRLSRRKAVFTPGWRPPARSFVGLMTSQVPTCNVTEEQERWRASRGGPPAASHGAPTTASRGVPPAAAVRTEAEEESGVTAYGVEGVEDKGSCKEASLKTSTARVEKRSFIVVPQAALEYESDADEEDEDEGRGGEGWGGEGEGEREGGEAEEDSGEGEDEESDGMDEGRFTPDRPVSERFLHGLPNALPGWPSV